MATKRKYRVEIGSHMRQVTASSRSDAVRQVIKILIRDKHLKRQPKATDDGWWEGVECEIVD
jgi:hypothetical protein